MPADELRDPVPDSLDERDPAGQEGAHRDGGIDMASRDRPEHVGEANNVSPKARAVATTPATKLVPVAPKPNDKRRHPDREKDQDQRPQQLGGQLSSHRLPPSSRCVRG